MNHADVKRHLADYLEGDLALEARARVDAHLDDCAECALEVDEMRRTVEILHRLPDPETPPMISANVMRRIRAGETQPGWIVRIVRATSGVLDLSFVLPASAIAVAALVALVVQDPGFISRFGVEEAANVGAVTAASAVPRQMAPGLARAQRGAELAGLDLRLPAFFRLSEGLASGLSGGSDGIGSPAFAQTAAPGVVRYRLSVEPSVPFASSGLAPSVLASRVAPGRAAYPQPLKVSEFGGLTAASNSGGARFVSRDMRRQDGRTQALTRGHSGAEDPRDRWLARGLNGPGEFARFLVTKNLAEQELWVSRLAERAEARGLLDDLVQALRASGDASAAILSDDFAAQADSHEADGAGSTLDMQGPSLR